MENFSMYKFYKGEKENPFADKNDNNRALFWQYESVFERDFKRYGTSDWFSFFYDHDMSDKFMALLSADEHDNLLETNKEPVFKLWLKYLFEFKLYPEYGGENTTEKLYYSY